MENKQITIKDKITTITIGLLAIFLVLGSYSAINYYVTKPRQLVVNPVINKEEIEKETIKISTDLEKYTSYKKVDLYPNGLVTPVDLIRVCEDKKKIPTECNKEIARITKVLSVSGNIKGAYLYIKSGVSRNGASFGPLTNFDSIWFYIDGGDFGGHLLRSKAIITRQSEDGLTELLYDLSVIPFTVLPYYDSAIPIVKNMLIEKINTPGNHLIGAFVSTLDMGRIFEMKLGYNGGFMEIK